MFVKFNKKQIKALESINSRAVEFYNEKHAENPNLYPEDDKNNTIRCFMCGILEGIIESGEFFVED